jgi:phage-related protein
MKWNINYYNEELEEEILDLPDSLLARYIHLTDLMQIHGPNLGMPHTKALGQGLFELRLKGKEGIARIFYCTFVNQHIHMLHSFIKKTDKIPLRELRLAKIRMREVKENG